MVQGKQNWAKALTQALNLATSVGAVLAIGLFGGRWLDAKFGTDFIYTVLGFILGAASAMKMLYENLMKDGSKNGLRDYIKKNDKNNS